MKDNITYNRPDNAVMVRTNGDEIFVICEKEEQMDRVVENLTTDTCKLAGYEEWDEGEDMKWILKFLVIDGDYEIVPEYN